MGLLELDQIKLAWRAFNYTVHQQQLSFGLLKERCWEHSLEEGMFVRLIWDKSTVKNKEMDTQSPWERMAKAVYWL